MKAPVSTSPVLGDAGEATMLSVAGVVLLGLKPPVLKPPVLKLPVLKLAWVEGARCARVSSLPVPDSVEALAGGARTKVTQP